MREQLVHGRAQPGVHQCQVMGTAEGLGFEHDTGGMAATCTYPWTMEEGPEGEHLCRKHSCKMCYGEKIFRPPRLPPKERSKNAKKYRGVSGQKMRSAMHDVNILPLLLFALFLTQISMIGIETSSGIKSVHPGWGSILFSVSTFKSVFSGCALGQKS